MIFGGFGMKNKRIASANVVRLTESAVMIALGTVLSLIKLIDLPYGGSVTPASMLPLVLIACRYGGGWGCFVGFVYGLLQALSGSSLSYVTGVWSVAAVLILDYGVAYAAAGVAGAFRKMKDPAAAQALGAAAFCAVRYLCHVVTGATVWAGVSVPTAAALGFSFLYNAAYMLPELLITAAAAYFVGTVLDVRSPSLRRQTPKTGFAPAATATAVAVAAIVADVILIFPHAQNEAGELAAEALRAAPWGAVIGVSAAAVVAAAVIVVVFGRRQKEGRT